MKHNNRELKSAIDKYVTVFPDRREPDILIPRGRKIGIIEAFRRLGYRIKEVEKEFGIKR